MTFEESDDFKKQELMSQVGKLLVSVLRQAQNEQRLVSGMYGAAKTLGSNPENVAFCILPQNHLNDVARHINHMLMEAYCNENDICIIKVDCEEKLAELLSVDNSSTSSASKNQRQGGMDYSCILVQTWNEEKTWEEEKLICLHDAEGVRLQTIIELPTS